MEFVSLKHPLLLYGSNTLIIPFDRSRNEVHAIICAACIPTVMPIFTRSPMKIFSWAIFRARQHRANTSDEVIRLGSIDDATSRSNRITFSSPLADGRIEAIDTAIGHAYSNWTSWRIQEVHRIVLERGVE